MTNDLIKQAEALIEKYNISGYIHRDATLLLPGLVEEIKQCKSLNNGLMANCNQLRDRCWKAEGELSKWQQIAIDERAQIIQYHRGILHPLDRPSNFWESMPKDEYAECRDLAAKELGLQLDDTGEELTIAYMLGSKDANDRLKVLQEYVRRLEKEFLDHTAARIYYESIPGVSDYWSWHDYPEEPCQMRPRQWFRDQAQAALEKIRRG